MPAPANVAVCDLDLEKFATGVLAGGPTNRRIGYTHSALLRWPVTVIPQIYFSLHVRTSTVSTFARRTPRAHVELDVRTWKLTCARGVKNKSAG